MKILKDKKQSQESCKKPNKYHGQTSELMWITETNETEEAIKRHI